MKRLQRLRATAALRDMVSEIGFGQGQLIQPLFLAEGLTKETPLDGLPGNSAARADRAGGGRIPGPAGAADHSVPAGRQQ